MAKKYWHELSDEEYQREVVEGELTSADCLKKYRQPDWCNYFRALHRDLGCWSLTDVDLRKKISRDYCKTCGEYIKE
jgi:hypothetical protein